MDKNKMASIIKELSGISYNEWFKLKCIVDTTFDKKKSEFEQELKLTDKDIQKTTHEQFG